MPDTALTSDATFDRFMTLSEKAASEEAIAVNDAFVQRMNRAIFRGREHAVPGTFVDETPPVGVLRPRGNILMSACGSPAAMCVENGSQGGGAETLK